MPANKVVHVTEDAHAAARAWCKERGTNMRDWVSGLILNATEGNVVETKPLEQLDREAKVDMAAPPFWEKTDHTGS